ncbi:MAG: response regulator transcription factor [Chitinophagaceae bacterium]|nr:response regulator transcription factor [Chitinophagaceae bacterium]
MDKAITILIADDNKYIRETIRFLLSRFDNLKLIGEAESGEEAISLARQLSPDVILIDINMAPINGFEATRKILKQNPSTKIIGLSVHKQPSYAKNILQLGAKGYVTKSSPHKEIIHAIIQVSEGKEYICAELIEHF